MLLVAGIIIGALVVYILVDKDLVITIKHINIVETPTLSEASLAEALNQNDPKEDEAYDNILSSLATSINSILEGGDLHGKENE